ncbi:MAG: UDP-N-acetylglucosamine 1-carboxyvinyltransferase, partial [Trueperaceae bacterium]|nr:UDP-N-acetylglucosamine 1-carboxyvinyltransferase [Trueperaceae bacterium]
MTPRSDDDAALVLHGGRPLEGRTRVQSAKNSALYLILASLLTDEPLHLRDVPKLSDVLVGLEILEHVGVDVRWDGADLHLHAAHVHRSDAPFRLVRKMRASFVAMGALLGRAGHARIGVPGGCAFGPRPVDRHIAAFEALGVDVDEVDGDFVAVARGPLEGHVRFPAPTVGGTQNVLLASALGSRRVVIENAALEPEVGDLVALLNAMGARIGGAGTSVLTVEGRDRLHGATFTPIADRIEAGTFLLATAATRGRTELHNVRTDHLGAVIATLEATGVLVHPNGDGVVVDAAGPLHAVDVEATPYPGFPTDLQAPFGAYLATLPGAAKVRDAVYPDRFTHVPELRKMGARLELVDRTLHVDGGALQPADVHAADIRAGGALVVAALAAKGTSRIGGVAFLDRGYERLDTRLRALGAHLERSGSPAPDPGDAPYLPAP